MSKTKSPVKATAQRRKGLRSTRVEAENSSSDEEWFDANQEVEKHSPPKKSKPAVDEDSPFSTDDESFDGDVQEEGPNWKQRLAQRQPGNFRRSTPVKKGTAYSAIEDQSLLDFIIAKDAFERLKGREFWQEAEMYEASGLNRTWQSLKERFLKTILPNLDSYNLSDAHKDLLKKIK